MPRASAPSDALVGPNECVFDFLDMRNGERWRLRPNASRLPWWIFAPNRRVPGTGPLDYLDAAKLLVGEERRDHRRDDELRRRAL